MAFPPMYAQQARGTLMPGQMISVNKYNVQVERFLSQGGFAHVYLVRTAEPVFNTTHHVLKRIAVANEEMLNEVKKEVDIMRILRGHPNIVYLIDAAWHKMPDGLFEVFILMEFCPGGGIIDMMNRRLRERLTESEILQIFVDVCEGVAAMHNLRPALLHRDLKVENILQASATSFKLCDFGSAMPVATRPPSTTQEMRMLEADLNKHTTLQYRAPEMVDVYLRRPIDEKSDVWALGVLLYKLCYYTTPFEEHGVLAILNVQYKFPPYPVYSQQMMALIASMLREHGTQRPSAFEILETVHKMRGTKSRFTYTIPQQQPLSPRGVQSPALTLPNQKEQEPSKPVNSGVQAREKVLEAIAPMRRGRPSSPTKGGRKLAEDAFNLVDISDNGPWGVVKPAKAHKSGLAAVSGGDSWKSRSPAPVSGTSSGMADAWSLPGLHNAKKPSSGDIASSTASGFGDSFDAALSLTSSQQAEPKPVPSPHIVKPKPISSLRSSDAFDSLNMFNQSRTQAMTLGEAQKAALSVPKPSPSPNLSTQPPAKFSISSPSPSSSLASTPPISQTAGSAFTTYMKRDASPLLKPKVSDQSLAAEQRFPSLEELDATFSPSSSIHTSAPSQASPPNLPPRPGLRSDKPLSSLSTSNISSNLRPAANPLESTPSSGPLRQDGIRSQQVTGTAMREARERTWRAAATGARQGDNDSIVKGPAKLKRQQRSRSRQRRSKSRDTDEEKDKLNLDRRPTLTRKHRSSVSLSPTKQRHDSVISDVAGSVKQKPSVETKDWLTGDDGSVFDNSAIIRASPEKRTSVLQSPSLAPQSVLPEVARSSSPVSPIKSAWPASSDNTFSANARRGPATKRKDSSSDDGNGPEDAVGFIPTTRTSELRRTGHHKGRQGSVHDLVDLFDVSAPAPATSKQERRSSAFITPSKPITSEPLKATATSSSTVTRTSVMRKPSLDTRKPSANHLRQPSAPAKSRNSPSPSKSRPQSMLVLPMQKAMSDMPASPKSSGLSPPPQLDKTIKQSRRSSISEMVSRYESIGVPSPGKVNGAPTQAPAPAPASKPARLRVASSSISSPTTASMRFPKISPTSSPTKATYRASLDISSKGDLTKEPASSGRTSPVPTSPVRRRASPLPQARNEPKGLLERRPIERKSPLPSPKDEKPSFPPTDESKQPDTRSASPDRPYQGVSKLIDQWQKKSEESSNVPYAVYKGGSRFKRPGIAAVGNKNS